MDKLQKLEAIFQTLSEHNRLKILLFIGEKERSVGEIVQETKLSQPLVSHHLRVLKDNDFLQTNRKGAFIFYSLNDNSILKSVEHFHDIFKDSDLKNPNRSGTRTRMMYKPKHKFRR